jgi:uncharacterized membrane protein
MHTLALDAIPYAIHLSAVGSNFIRGIIRNVIAKCIADTYTSVVSLRIIKLSELSRGIHIAFIP